MTEFWFTEEVSLVNDMNTISLSDANICEFQNERIGDVSWSHEEFDSQSAD